MWVVEADNSAAIFMTSFSGDSPYIGIHRRELFAFRLISGVFIVLLGLAFSFEFSRRCHLYYEVYSLTFETPRFFSFLILVVCFIFFALTFRAVAGVTAQTASISLFFITITILMYFIGLTGRVKSIEEAREDRGIESALSEWIKREPSELRTKSIQYLRRLKASREEASALEGYWEPSKLTWIVLLVFLPAFALWFLWVAMRINPDLYWLRDPNKL
jgi:hypothetical protein